MSDAMHALLTATPLLNVHHPDIESLVARLREADDSALIPDFCQIEACGRGDRSAGFSVSGG